MSGVRVYGSDRKVIARIEKLEVLTRSGIEYAAYQSGKQLVRSTSQEILRRPKSGRTYIRKDRLGRRRKHVASAPGETHANMTGALRRSLGFKVSTNQLEFGYGVENNDAPEYAKMVEEGTSRMAARPSLQNGIRSNRRNIMNNLEDQIGKRLEGKVVL